MVRNWRRSIGAASLGAGLLAAGALGGASAQQTPAPKTWTAFAGQIPGNQVLISSNDFQPRPLEINVGDTVVWKNFGFHTVTFGRERVSPFDVNTQQPNPVSAAPVGGNTYNGQGVVNSGFMLGPGEFKVTFTAPGTFTYLCDLHPGMDGTLVVKPAGQPVAMTPAAAEAAAIDHYHRLDFSGRVIPMLVNQGVESPDGTVFQKLAGTGDGHVAIEMFLPRSLVIRAGQTVQWTNSDPVTPHTVTLLPGGGLPDFSAGPPPIDLPEGFPFAPFGGGTYSGAEFVNSGALWNEARFEQMSVGSSYALMFTEPGTYQYFCVLHVETGMVGTITVLP